MKIRWQVDDGYCGGSRPQYTEIPNDELSETETDEERDNLIDEYIQNDFEQKITWTILGIEE